MVMPWGGQRHLVFKIVYSGKVLITMAKKKVDALFYASLSSLSFLSMKIIKLNKPFKKSTPLDQANFSSSSSLEMA